MALKVTTEDGKRRSLGGKISRRDSLIAQLQRVSQEQHTLTSTAGEEECRAREVLRVEQILASWGIFL